MLIVATHLSPRGLRGLRSALALSQPVVRALPDLPGFCGGRLLLDHRRDLWTLTGWSDRASLEAFGAVHAPVAARVGDVAVGSSTTGWQQDELPTWGEVRARWGDGHGPGRGLSRPLPPGRALVGA